MEQAGSYPVAKRQGYIREALAELRRKRERSKLRKQVQQQQKDRAAALARLGQLAWEQKAGLAAFPEFQNRLAGIEQQAGEQAEQIRKLDGEKAVLAAQQRDEDGKFTVRRKAVEELRQPVDTALRAARQNQSNWQQFLRQSAARQARVVAELGALEQQLAVLASSPTPDHIAKSAAAQARKEQLAAERASLEAQLTQGQEAQPAVQAEVARLTTESQRHQDDINRLEAERQATLAPILAGLQRLDGELRTLHQQANAVAGARAQQFQQLGLALYASGSAEPLLAQAQAEIAALDRSSANTQQALQASLALTQTVPPGTMLKFWSTVILGPLLLAALAFGAFAGWDWWHERKLVKDLVPTPASINPYLAHSLNGHPAYMLARQLSEAKSETRVQQLMLEAFRAIHLGVYTHDGRQILAGAELSDKDFFLYDFQWKTLARAFLVHNVRDLPHHHALLGKALLGRDDSAQVEAALNRAIVARYQAAEKAPDDPSSYLILLVDALARQQLKPYSLAEIEKRPGTDLLVDPLQSFLIMLDFFVAPETAPKSAARRWKWQLVPSAHAQSACDTIAGNSAEKGWGTGVKLGGLANSGLGAATQISGALGDLLLLYGVTIKISPTSYTIHLTHEEKSTDSFIALVSFDPDGVPDEAIKCGWLAGKMMPQPGERMKNVELTWNIEPVWPSYLLVTRETVKELTGHLGFQTKTDSDGSSIFEIEATDCPHKEGGPVVGRDLMMTVTARMLTTKMPTPGTLGWISLLTKLGPGGLEYLMNGRTGYCRFRAEWHEKPPKRPQRSGG